MLSESEKKNIRSGQKCGKSYQQIAQNLLWWRYFSAIIALSKEVEAYVKEREL